MAGRSSTTYQKRQKELARQDKAREKAAKRAQKKLEKLKGPSDDNMDENMMDDAIEGEPGELSEITAGQGTEESI